MANIFFISDTHFGHANMCTFVDYDGNRVRPYEPDEVDELMIQNWNQMVKPEDKIYHLGDVVFQRTKGDKILSRLNGKKCLIRGNHDNFQCNWYLKYFYDVRGCYNFENFLMTHVPIHKDSKARFKMNIHGHLHNNIVKLNDKPDVWYRNVCVDHTGYIPIPYEQIQHEYSVFKQQGRFNNV